MSVVRYVLVAGEASGDILGANLIASLKKRHPDALFEGIGGPLMQAQGMQSFYPMDRLSVMGLVEVLGRLRELLGIRKALYQHCITQVPTAFIGIDSPDFNLPLARKLKQKGICTIHYVSPSVWAWRQKRIFKIKESVDLMMTLFPFEQDIYVQHQIPVVCVGHPLADDIPMESDKATARKALKVSLEKMPLIAVLPGSREGEVNRLFPLFMETMKALKAKQPDCQFLIPAVNADRRGQIEGYLQQSDLPATIVDGRSREVMQASDAVLLASGTAALEAMLVKRPMAVAYRFSGLTYAIMSRMLKVPYVSLPNLLAGKGLVPELIQDQATPEKLAEALLDSLSKFEQDNDTLNEFNRIHQLLALNAGDKAAEAVLSISVN